MPCSCPLVHRISENLPTGGHGTRKKIVTLLRQPAAPPARSGTAHKPVPASLSLPAPLLPAYGLTKFRSSGLTAGPPILAQAPPAKVFGREGCGEGEPFSQKVLLPASFSLLHISRRLPAVPKQKNPRRNGDKKRPPRAVSCKGVSNNLWQRPTFPHDVMQYHRRWRA